MNAIGEKTSASRQPVGAVGIRQPPRKAPSESGAPPYISTVALVIRPTSDCQLGNGRKQMQPVMKAASRPTQGTPRELVHSNADGT